MDDIPGADERRREQERIRKEYPDLYYYTVGVVLVVALIIAGYALLPDRDGYLTNLFTEATSVAVTLVILNRMAEARERRRYKQDLIYRMGSQVNAEAIRAVEKLRQHGWLQDGTLQRSNLDYAKLAGAPLSDANLQGARLVHAELRDAFLDHANLKGAHLTGADLSRAKLREASLEGACLRDTNLCGAILREVKLMRAFLRHAKLEGADLRDADLTGADLVAASLKEANLEDVILPNGERWYPGYPMCIFTKSADWNRRLNEWADINGNASPDQPPAP